MYKLYYIPKNKFDIRFTPYSSVQINCYIIYVWETLVNYGHSMSTYGSFLHALLYWHGNKINVVIPCGC
jgi:hypothetical protein